jgi:uncharacterized protein YutE (UPF0331/DUF86 family)/predicted nucleotidyltransferase
MIKLKRLEPKKIRERLKSLKDIGESHTDITALWLFGSYARAEETPLSDVDLAYLPREGLSKGTRERMDCELYLALSRLLGTDEITLIDLKEAPVALAFTVLKGGKEIFRRDSEGIRAFKERILGLYPEVKRLREEGMLTMPIDEDKVAEQIRLLKNDLRKLKEKSRLSRSEYLADEDAQAVVERRFQTATEACVNIGNHLIAALDLKLAEDYASVFLSLAEGGVISRELAEKMADMARFRNLLVHIYWRIDHEKIHKEMDKRIEVLEAFSEEVERFLRSL